MVSSSSLVFGFLLSASLALASSVLFASGLFCSSAWAAGAGSPGRFVRSGLIVFQVSPSSLVCSKNCVPS